MRSSFLYWAASAYCVIAVAAAAPVSVLNDGAMAWAAALRGSLKELDPIAAAQIQQLNPDLRLDPGLLRLRGLDPEDADQRAALDAVFRSLQSRGYTPQRLSALRIDEVADRRLIEDLSSAYEAGLAHARAFSGEVARNLDQTTTRETSPGALAALQSRLTAMERLYGDAAVAQAKFSLRKRLRADGAAAAVFFSLP